MKRLYVAVCAGCGHVAGFEVRDVDQEPSARLGSFQKSACRECQGINESGVGVELLFLDVEWDFAIYTPPPARGGTGAVKEGPAPG